MGGLGWLVQGESNLVQKPIHVGIFHDSFSSNPATQSSLGLEDRCHLCKVYGGERLNTDENLTCPQQGVTSPLAGQMFFRASMFSAFGAAKRWLGTNADGSTRALTTADFYKVCQLAHWTAPGIRASKDSQEGNQPASCV